MCPSERHLQGAAATAPAGLRSAFDAMDADRDGKIGREDLKAFYGGRASDDEIRSMIASADEDRSGFVDFEEFERVLDVSAGGGGRGIMEEAFRVMDRDRDGLVGFDDLKAYLGMAGMAVEDSEVTAMLDMAGGGGDGREGVGYEALLKVLAFDS